MRSQNVDAGCLKVGAKQLSVALPLGFLDQEQARAPYCKYQANMHHAKM
jgi:hypothetical protein